MNLSKTQPERSAAAQGHELALLEKAIGIAVEAHRGHLDRYGAPYILHPLRVMARVETVPQKIVAILHDVVEDTEWTFEGLEREGFPPEIVAALDGLTKRPGEPYEARVDRAAANPIARRVKVADLEDNMDIRRCTDETGPDLKRLAKRLAAWKNLAGRQGP